MTAACGRSIDCAWGCGGPDCPERGMPQGMNPDARAEAVEVSFRRRTLDEVYGYDASKVPAHSISPARLAGV